MIQWLRAVVAGRFKEVMIGVEDAEELVVVVEAAVETIETLQNVGHNCGDQGPWKPSVQREGM
jgi:hypothetical protein